jgi:hypothetical protein
MPETASKSFYAIGDIAHLYGATTYRVLYAIRVLNVTPMGRAGNAKVYSAEDVQRIGERLNQAAQYRAGERGRSRTHAA